MTTLITKPIWTRTEFLKVVDASDDTYRIRHRRGALPWPTGGLESDFPFASEPKGRRRFTQLHAIAWNTMEALGLPLGLGSQVGRDALNLLLMGGIYRPGMSDARMYTDVLINGGPSEDEPVLGYAVRGLSDGVPSKSPHGEGPLYLAPVVGPRSEIQSFLEQWASMIGPEFGTGTYFRRVILVDIAGEYRWIAARAKSLGLWRG